MVFPYFMGPDASVDACGARTLSRSAAHFIARQQADIDMVKKEKWTEADLDALGVEEQDFLERKAGLLFNDQDKFLNTLAKALSAFSNSGGGSIILGAKDDGRSYDGLPPNVGNATIRDWIEMKVPTLIDYPLSDFRTHTVAKDAQSKIPTGREVIIIDVGDSAAAPHQSKRDKLYYRREGGRSVPAPHFHLELLRQRLANPKLEAELIKTEFYNAYKIDQAPGIFLILEMIFNVKNIGRISANHWQINIKRLSAVTEPFSRLEDLYFSDFPKPESPKGVAASINTGSRVILPDCCYSEKIKIGLHLRPLANSEAGIASDLDALVAPISIGCSIATETSAGILLEYPLGLVIKSDEISRTVRERCPDCFR